MVDNSEKYVNCIPIKIPNKMNWYRERELRFSVSRESLFTTLSSPRNRLSQPVDLSLESLVPRKTLSQAHFPVECRINSYEGPVYLKSPKFSAFRGSPGNVDHVRDGTFLEADVFWNQ